MSQIELWNLSISSSSSNTDLITTLSTLRKKVTNKDFCNKLVEDNIVSKLISLLERPNTKITDIALSILGNLLFVSDISKVQLRTQRGLEIISQIVTNLANDSICCRGIRCLANSFVGQPKNVEICFHLGVIPILVKTLNDSSSSSKTKQVSVRALRLLGNNSKNRRKIVEASGIKAMSLLLTSESERDLLKAITKCLAHYSYGCELNVAHQITDVEHKGYERLTRLVEQNDLFSLIILINLSHISSIRPELGNAGAISVLVNKISEYRYSKETHNVAKGITALCLFCRESVNRIKLRDFEGLKLFVELLTEELYAPLHDRILHSLLQFHYDDQSLRLLEKYGIIPILLSFLAVITEQNNKDTSRHSCEEEISKNSDSVHSKENKNKGDERSNLESGVKRPKTFHVYSPSYQAVQIEFQQFLRVRETIGDEESLPYNSSPSYSPYGSPESSSGASSSTSSSPHYSPFPSLFYSDSPPISPRSEDEISYSPIESFSENEDESLKNNEFPFKKEQGNTNGFHNKVHWITQLLFRFSQAEKPHESILSLDSTKTIVNYLCHIKSPLESIAARVLLRLSKNWHCIMSFIYQKHLSWLRYKLESHITLLDSPCEPCHQLLSFQVAFQRNISALAETGYAEGEMCHNLLKGSKEEKRNIAISTALVSRPRKLLRNLLLNHEGLDILIDVLESESVTSTLFVDAVLSINVLASHLGIITPSFKLTKQKLSQCLFPVIENLENEVTFILDSNEELKADRDVLIKGSDVFAAMLNTSFSESRDSRIKIPFTSMNALYCLLHYLYGCTWCNKAFYQLTAKVLLELLSLSDQYLLNEFNEAVSREIVVRCLHGSSEDLIEIYKSALQVQYLVRGLGDSLAKCTLHSIMVGVLPSISKRAELFGILLNSSLHSDFADDIHKIIKEKLLEKS